MKSSIGPGGWIVIIAILGIVVLGIAALLVTADNAESAPPSQSCYVIMFTEALKGDTWTKIANHWGMSVSTLRAMNKGVRLVIGAQVKVAVWVGCPR